MTNMYYTFTKYKVRCDISYFMFCRRKIYVFYYYTNPLKTKSEKPTK